MNTGRRSFLKGFAALVGGLVMTPQARIRALEKKNASQYTKKFRENSLPKPPLQTQTWYATSGVYCVAGSWHPSAQCSGYFGPIVSG